MEWATYIVKYGSLFCLFWGYKNHIFKNQDKYLKPNVKKSNHRRLGSLARSVKWGRSRGWVRTCLVLWVLVDSVGGLCAWEQCFIFLKNTSSRDCSPGSPAFPFLFCKLTRVQETELEEMLRNKNQWSQWGDERWETKREADLGVHERILVAVACVLGKETRLGSGLPLSDS